MPATEARVLIIEDNDALRVMLFTVLRRHVRVDTASTAAEAFERVTNCDYPLILIDLDLAEGDPGRFLKEFRTSRPTATSFILAVRDPNKDVLIEDASVNALVAKPIEIDTLAEIVRECALVVPPPPDPLDCPPAESSRQFDFDGGSQLAN